MSKFKDKKVFIFLFLIIILQTVISIYAGAKREDYHIDEYYSHGLMQYDNTFIMSNEDFYNNWHNVQYFKDYVQINEQDKWDFRPVYTNQINDVHPPLYYLLLRIACSFNLNNFSKWPGIVLNIIIAGFSTVILYLIGKKLFKSKYIAFLMCLVNAMCIATIQTIIFIRMYELFALNSLLLIYWHIMNKDKKLEIKDLVLLGILIITGFLTHYYYAIIVATLYFMFVAKFIKEKRKQELIKYTITMIIAVLAAIGIFPYSIYHIFFGYRGQEVITNMGNMQQYLAKIYGYIEILQENIFNGKGMTIFLTILILGILAIIEKILNRNKQKKKDNNILYVLLPTIVYFILIAIGGRFFDYRYIMPITTLIIISIVYIIHRLLEVWENRKITLPIITILCIMFCCTNIPKYSNNLYTRKGTTEQVEKTLKIIDNRPFILITQGKDGNDSKFMETYQIVSKVNETYILMNNINKEILEKALENKNTENGIVIMVRWKQEEKIVQQVFDTGLFSQCKQLYDGVLMYYNILEFK